MTVFYDHFFDSFHVLQHIIASCICYATNEVGVQEALSFLLFFFGCLFLLF